jgi:glycosyltransferase involved in cell wall biosynthesis
MQRLAIVVSHPTQYYSPWFRHLAAESGMSVRVYYLWNFGVTEQVDKGFGTALLWDLPLLNGYEHEFVLNVSRDPGTHHFRGLDNPGLRKALERQSPDAVLLFGHGWKTHARLLWRGAPKGAALLYRGDSHLLGPQPRGMKAQVKSLATRRLLANVDQFLAVGSANADYFRAYGAGDERITFVPHCVDNARFAAQGNREAGRMRRRELGLSDSDVVILFAGKLEEKKRPLDLLQAFQMLTLPARLVFAGAGPLEEELRQRAAGVAGVQFLPFQNQTAMPSLFAAADVFVLPSFGRQETWGLAVNEAMNCGCAIIVTDHVGCARDLVHEGQNGRVVAAGDAAALAGALQDAVADPQRLKRWQAKSREIIQGYSYETATEGVRTAMAKVVRRVTAS